MKTLSILEELKMTARYNEEMKKQLFGNIYSRTNVVLDKLRYEFFQEPRTLKRKIFRKGVSYEAVVNDLFHEQHGKRGRLTKCVNKGGDYLYEVVFPVKGVFYFHPSSIIARKVEQLELCL